MLLSPMGLTPDSLKVSLPLGEVGVLGWKKVPNCFSFPFEEEGDNHLAQRQKSSHSGWHSLLPASGDMGRLCPRGHMGEGLSLLTGFS